MPTLDTVFFHAYDLMAVPRPECWYTHDGHGMYGAIGGKKLSRINNII